MANRFGTSQTKFKNNFRKKKIMRVEILTGVFSLIASLVGTFGGIITSTKLTNYQINELKKQVDKHNSVIERTFRLEEHNRYVDERIARLESEVKSEKVS